MNLGGRFSLNAAIPSAKSPEAEMQLLLAHESSPDEIIALSPQTAPLTDDRPINEYFLLRTPLDRLSGLD